MNSVFDQVMSSSKVLRRGESQYVKICTLLDTDSFRSD